MSTYNAAPSGVPHIHVDPTWSDHWLDVIMPYFYYVGLGLIILLIGYDCWRYNRGDW